jgi:hypothetical protein
VRALIVRARAAGSSALVALGAVPRLGFFSAGRWTTPRRAPGYYRRAGRSASEGKKSYETLMN